MCRTIASVWETSATSADYLKYRYIQEAVAVGAELSVSGKDTLNAAGEQLAGANWVTDDLTDDLESLCNQIETDLSLLDVDYVTVWDGGFTILKPCDDEQCRRESLDSL